MLRLFRQVSRRRARWSCAFSGRSEERALTLGHARQVASKPGAAPSPRPAGRSLRETWPAATAGAEVKRGETPRAPPRGEREFLRRRRAPRLESASPLPAGRSLRETRPAVAAGA